MLLILQMNLLKQKRKKQYISTEDFEEIFIAGDFEQMFQLSASIRSESQICYYRIGAEHQEMGNLVSRNLPEILFK